MTSKPFHDIGVGDLLQDRYRIVDRLAGSMGVTFVVDDLEKSADSSVQRRMVAKTLHSGVRESHSLMHLFLDEAQVWMNLERGKNVVQAYKVEEIDGLPYVFAEFVERGVLPNNLAAWIHHDLTPIEVTLHLVIQLLDGLWYAYQDIVELHGDLKPSNLLISSDVTLKINDWGFAREKGRTALGAEQIARYAAYHAQSPYTAPEARRDLPILSRSIDFYSLGVILGEMLTGSTLPEDSPADSIEAMIERKAIVCPTDVATRLAGVISPLLSRDPDKRGDLFVDHVPVLVDLYKKMTGIGVIDESDSIIITAIPAQRRTLRKKAAKLIARFRQRRDQRE